MRLSKQNGNASLIESHSIFLKIPRTNKFGLHSMNNNRICWEYTMINGPISSSSHGLIDCVMNDSFTFDWKHCFILHFLSLAITPWPAMPTVSVCQWIQEKQRRKNDWIIGCVPSISLHFIRFMMTMVDLSQYPYPSFVCFEEYRCFTFVWRQCPWLSLLDVVEQRLMCIVCVWSKQGMGWKVRVDTLSSFALPWWFWMDSAVNIIWAKLRWWIGSRPCWFHFFAAKHLYIVFGAYFSFVFAFHI